MTMRERVAIAALWAVAVAALASWLVLVAAHLGDRFLVDHAAGVRMALAQHAAAGTLYPPLFDGEVFGGTRYLPLGIVAHAALARLAGDLLVGGQLLGVVSVATLAGLVLWVIRRAGCPWPVAAALAGSLLATQPGLGATFGMRADALPAALQVAAVALVTTVSGPWGAVAAGLLAGAALPAKLTAVWAAVAIGAWLALTDRRRLAAFGAAWAASAVALFAVFEIASGGRMSATVLPLTFAGVEGAGGAVTAPNRLVRALFMEATTTWALLPLPAIATVDAARRRALGPWHLALMLQAPLLLVVFTDIGVGANQLVDLAALTVVVAGVGAARLAWRPLSALAAAAAGVVVWVAASVMLVNAGPHVRAAARSLGEGSPDPPLADVVTADMTLLSDDPGIAVLLGRTPVVTDPFMLPRIEQLEPAAVAGLADRLRQGGFDVVALTQPLEDEGWWRDYHLGETVIAAVRDGYRAAGVSDGYYLYVPLPHGDLLKEWLE